MGLGSLKEDQESVALSEVFHRAAVAQGNAADLGVVLTEDAKQLLWFGSLSESGEAAACRRRER